MSKNERVLQVWSQQLRQYKACRANRAMVHTPVAHSTLVFFTLSMGLYFRPTTSRLERDRKMIDPGLNLAAPWLTVQFIHPVGCGVKKRGRPTYPVHSSSLMIADAYSHITAFHHLVEEWHVTPSATASIAFYYVHLHKRERVCMCVCVCVCVCVHACMWSTSVIYATKYTWSPMHFHVQRALYSKQ